jgi:hypothetical protein
MLHRELVRFTKDYLGDKIKKDEMGGTRSTRGRDEKCIQYFGWKTEGKRPLGRSRRRWEDNITMILGK